jgi:hypothetical protein
MICLTEQLLKAHWLSNMGIKTHWWMPWTERESCIFSAGTWFQCWVAIHPKQWWA